MELDILWVKIRQKVSSFLRVFSLRNKIIRYFIFGFVLGYVVCSYLLMAQTVFVKYVKVGDKYELQKTNNFLHALNPFSGQINPYFYMFLFSKGE